MYNRRFIVSQQPQFGNGLGSILFKFFRGLVPHLKTGLRTAGKVISKAAKSKTGQELQKVAKSHVKIMAKNAAKRAIAGDNIMAGIKQDSKNARKDLANALSDGEDDRPRVVRRKKRKKLNRTLKGSLLR